MRGATFSIANKTRGIPARLPFKKMKEEVLGASYDLSLVLLTPREARAVTLRTKNKDKASNVLAFPLTKTSGEIFLCPSTAKKEAPLFGMPERDFLGYLFIHGLLHIKGHLHGATMEKAEQKLLARFNLCKRSSPASTSAPTKSK